MLLFSLVRNNGLISQAFTRLTENIPFISHRIVSRGQQISGNWVISRNDWFAKFDLNNDSIILVYHIIYTVYP